MEAHPQKDNSRIRVLVADDSPTVRMMLCRMLEADPQIVIVGMADNGREAVDQVAMLKPDLVTMDVRMPVMDGLSAIEQIMAYSPVPVLVVSSVVDPEHTTNAAKALGAGAVDVMSKPEPKSLAEFNQIALELQGKVRLLSRVRVITHPRARLQEREQEIRQPRTAQNRERSSKLVAVASSTGGPQALQAILSKLPQDFPASILVVQHIARGFTEGLVSWLGSSCRLKVRQGADGEPIVPGEVMVAPDAIHMIVTPERRIGLVDRQIASPHKPSADVLLESVAAVYGNEAVGVILTGMGRDGASGIKAIHDSGGHTIAQDENSSVIFSMAKEAIMLGGVENVVSLTDIDGILKAIV
jgi:two-component system chemotaxis response regulator CheB